MFNYLTFKDKTLLITPDKLKTKIREEIMSLNTLLNIKIMSILCYNVYHFMAHFL